MSYHSQDYLEQEGDRLYDEECSRQARIDLGLECPDCAGHKEIASTVVFSSIKLFECACGAKWFDTVTEPATVPAPWTGGTTEWKCAECGLPSGSKCPSCK